RPLRISDQGHLFTFTWPLGRHVFGWRVGRIALGPQPPGELVVTAGPVTDRLPARLTLGDVVLAPSGDGASVVQVHIQARHQGRAVPLFSGGILEGEVRVVAPLPRVGQRAQVPSQGWVVFGEFDRLVPAADVEPRAVGLAEAAQAVLVEGYVPHACQPHDVVSSS
ncbi:hypothetical protein STRTUCAR8_03697, partial [Streptomyces turgidiscabies Car8]